MLRDHQVVRHEPGAPEVAAQLVREARAERHHVGGVGQERHSRGVPGNDQGVDEPLQIVEVARVRREERRTRAVPPHVLPDHGARGVEAAEARRRSHRTSVTAPFGSGRLTARVGLYARAVCGICGIVAPGRPPETDVVEAMASRIAHRGPDGAATFAGEGAALGFRRLAILDLSDAGMQPFAGADGRLQLVHNGEIYNYRELRRELEAAGRAFHTGTDTEVVLAAYEH